MSENSFKSIRNKVITSVISGVLLLAVPAIRDYVVAFLSWGWSGVLLGWQFLFAWHSLPGWSWLILFVLAVVGMCSIWFAIKGESKKPEYMSYTEDYILGANWRWSWIGNQISNAWCYCPRCDATLVYDDSSCRSIYSGESRTDFICENCNRQIITSIPGGNKDYSVSAVKREVDRRIRTGEYKKH